jgi:hypothetical protein
MYETKNVRRERLITISMMVNHLPESVMSSTSLNPTVEMVMIVMYSASRNENPSITMYPRVPNKRIMRKAPNASPTLKKG